MAKRKVMSAVKGAQQAVRREFNGLPVVDAQADLQVVVNEDEVISAIGHEKDPENCVLAKACARQLRSSKLLFFRSVAYVEHPGPDGERRVYRYQVGHAARAIIEAFDRGKSVRGNVLVTLEAPRPGNTLDYLREKEKRGRQNRNKRRREAHKALINGTLVGGKNKSGVGLYKRPKSKDISVRTGTGMVHFNVTEE